VFPSNLLRTWHLQTMIFWVATAYVVGALFVAAGLGGGDPKGQRPLIHVLFWALVVVVTWRSDGSGRPCSPRGCCSGSGWCIARSRARLDPELRTFVNFFLIATFAIPGHRKVCWTLLRAIPPRQDLTGRDWSLSFAPRPA